ncbi:MAG: hypothetical protein ACE5KT_09340 [Methanosarcinales archaeon]
METVKLPVDIVNDIISVFKSVQSTTKFSKEYIDSLIETLEILSDKKFMEDLRKAEHQVKKGEVISFEDAIKELGLEDEFEI